jgi:hypothetical protein
MVIADHQIGALSIVSLLMDFSACSSIVQAQSLTGFKVDRQDRNLAL